MDVNHVTFFNVEASLCDLVVNLTMFLLSISASLAISFEFSLLVFSESSPRKEMISCIFLSVSTYLSRVVDLHTKLEPLFARSSRLSTRAD